MTSLTFSNGTPPSPSGTTSRLSPSTSSSNLSRSPSVDSSSIFSFADSSLSPSESPEAPLSAVAQELSPYILLQEMREVLEGSKEPSFSPEEKTQLESLKDRLPAPLNIQIIQAPFLRSSWTQFVKTHMGQVKIEKSKDLAGHGGTLKVALPRPEGPMHLFLKPKDPIEAGNYQVIEKFAPDVTAYMPKIHGEIQIGKRVYLIMQNVRIGSDGKPQEQLVDAKLAGKIDSPDFNPIANQKEIFATRHKSKSSVDYQQMKLGADAAPHYMVASGRVRLINYKDSKDVLQESLKTISTDHLRKLLQDLKNIKETLFKNDTIAFIGASIILIKTAEGEIKPYLIDPAHIIVRPATPDEPPRQPVDANIKIYYGNPTTDDFQKQHDSNQIAMRSLMDSVIELLNERTDQNPEQPPEAPQDPQLVGAQQQSLLLNLQDDYKPVHHPEN